MKNSNEKTKYICIMYVFRTTTTATKKNYLKENHSENNKNKIEEEEAVYERMREKIRRTNERKQSHERMNEQTSVHCECAVNWSSTQHVQTFHFHKNNIQKEIVCTKRKRERAR